MAEISLPSTNEKHVNGLEMEPSIATPLQQIIRKRSQNDETVSTRRTHQRPRKKIYRPKVIGEGRPRKSKGPRTPVMAKRMKVSSKSKTLSPVTPNRALPEPKKSMEDNSDTSGSTIIQVDNQCDSCRDLRMVEIDEWVYGKDVSQECIKKGRPWTKKRTPRRRPTSKFNCLKETISMFKEGLWGRFISNSDCMKSKNNIKLRLKNTKKKLTGLRSARGKGRGSSVRPLPFIFCKRKRSSMVRRCNLAALSALPLCNQLPRNRHKRAVKSNKAEDFKGNDNGGRLSQNQNRNHKTSLASSKLNCSSRDDDKGRKINEFGKQSESPSGLELNDRCASVETAIKDVDNKGIPTEESAQMALSRPASYEFSNTQSAGALLEMGDLSHTDKLSSTSLHLLSSGYEDSKCCEHVFAGNNSGQLTMRWLDIRHFLKILNARSGKSPPEKDFSLTTRIITGNANELRPTLDKLILWNRSEGTMSNPEHNMLTAHDEGTLEEETNSGQEKQIIPYARKGGKKTRKQEHDPSSVHGSQGAIVPHHKPLNSTKKRELGRVYLDPRSITVWNLLLQNEGNSVKEKIDVDTDTEKWWANERDFFRGRISAFIARLHVILGDRRFSPWKGSVVDSVVGVFLTQNVSDHLSSSAFMSLAATFPLPVAEDYRGQEVFRIQQSTVRNEESKTTGDLEEAEELMSANDAIASQDFQMSSVNQSSDGTQIFSSICLEDDSGTFVSSNLEATDNTVLDSNKSTFVQGFDGSQSSTSSCESHQENKNLESEEMDYRNQNPTSENLNHRHTTHTLRSLEKCHLCLESSSQSKSGLEKNPEISNCCEGTMEGGLELTPIEKSQRFIGGVGKVQNQSELSPIDDSSEKLNVDVEKAQSQESLVQALDSANDTEKKGKTGTQKYMEAKDAHDFDDEKKTEIPKRKAKKIKMKQEIDWDSLQRKWDTMRRVYSSCEPRSRDHMDSVDWEAVRFAEPIKIAEAIKERGQHNIIAGRIKEFLDRMARLHGCIDLEWLRNAPPNDVKEYLLEIQGLGLKSVECTRLLALQQVAFPVDINVGRIAVRLGWVPLEPLPEEVQIHLLETFPMMDSIQKYLWPRLCTLDQRTLYELHYQLITFGKVFCTKRKPNCNACPLRAECRHFASAFASARLALPGLAEKRIVTSMVPDKGFEGTAQVMNPASILHIEGNPFSGSRNQTNSCEPIIEVPQSPEPAAYAESPLTDIEDLCEYDSDDVPIIRLSTGQCTTTLQNCMDIESKLLQDCNITRALVPLHHKVASIPTCKLKHIGRLRTEHQVYELPDTHPLLFELERREPNDPLPYLLCILSPGETVNSSETPYTRCMHQELGELCSEGSCSSCNIIREQNSGMVRGTILIPCRTAMRGTFPLNGTYFQVNEVFADDESSKKPIHVPREWIWNLPRRIAYFGTSTTTIFRGLAKEDIQYCFQKGFICVRGFDRRTRTPKRLAERLHKPTHASAKAKANKSEDQRPKTDASNSNSNSNSPQ